MRGPERGEGGTKYNGRRLSRVPFLTKLCMPPSVFSNEAQTADDFGELVFPL